MGFTTREQYFRLLKELGIFTAAIDKGIYAFLNDPPLSDSGVIHWEFDDGDVVTIKPQEIDQR